GDAHHVGHLLCGMGHDRRGADGEEGIGRRVHHDVVRDVVDERAPFPDGADVTPDGIDGDGSCHVLLPSLALPRSGSEGRGVAASSQPGATGSPARPMKPRASKANQPGGGPTGGIAPDGATLGPTWTVPASNSATGACRSCT